MVGLQRVGLLRYARPIWPGPGGTELDHRPTLSCQPAPSAIFGNKRLVYTGVPIPPKYCQHAPKSATSVGPEPIDGILTGEMT